MTLKSAESRQEFTISYQVSLAQVQKLDFLKMCKEDRALSWFLKNTDIDHSIWKGMTEILIIV